MSLLSKNKTPDSNEHVLFFKKSRKADWLKNVRQIVFEHF